MLAGLISGISGILSAGTYGSASPGNGNLLLLPAYAAAFLSLTTIQPGRFNATGTGIAIYFLATGDLRSAAHGPADLDPVGVLRGILVVAVVISRILNKRRNASAK